MLEDYRAGLAIDQLLDADDRKAGRRVACPTLALWSARDDLEALYGNVLDVWRPWTTELKGQPIESGHHMAEEAAEAVAAAVMAFLREPTSSCGELC